MFHVKFCFSTACVLTFDHLGRGCTLEREEGRGKFCGQKHCFSECFIFRTLFIRTCFIQVVS